MPSQVTGGGQLPPDAVRLRSPSADAYADRAQLPLRACRPGVRGPPHGPHNGDVTSEPIPVSRRVDGGLAKLLPDVDRPRARLLTLDGAPQSYVDPGDPRHLEFEYARRVGHVLDTAAPPGRPLAVLHCGAGALTLPRYTAATRPGSRQHVVDVDGELLAFVAEQLPLPPGSGIRTETADARAALEAQPPGSLDAVISDVYRGARVPPHLTTLPYVRAARRALGDRGRYVANLADSAPFRFLASQLATLGAVFAHRCLIAEPGVLRGRRFGNVVLVGSEAPLPVDALARRCAADPFPARIWEGAELDRIAAGARPVQDGEAPPSPEPPEGAFSVGGASAGADAGPYTDGEFAAGSSTTGTSEAGTTDEPDAADEVRRVR